MDNQNLQDPLQQISTHSRNSFQLLGILLVVVIMVALASIVGYVLGKNKTAVKYTIPVKQSLPVKQSVPIKQNLPIKTTQSVQGSFDTTDSIPYWSDPLGFYHIYSTCDQSSNCDIFVKTREVNPKITKVLTLNNFYGDFGDVLWAKVNNQNNSQFILKIVGPGDGHAYYLLHVDGSTAVRLNLESGPSSYDEIISWLDDSRILIKHTTVNTDLTNLQNSTTTSTYEIAPVSDLSQRKPVSL